MVFVLGLFWVCFGFVLGLFWVCFTLLIVKVGKSATLAEDSTAESPTLLAFLHLEMSLAGCGVVAVLALVAELARPVKPENEMAKLSGNASVGSGKTGDGDGSKGRNGSGHCCLVV